MGLSNKRRVFIEEYLKCWNATEAARRAGYKHPNSQGPRLLVDVGIQEAIAERIKEKVMGADEVLIRLADQARADIADVMSIPEGSKTFLVDTDKVAELGHLIRKIRYTKNGIEIEMYNSQQALELIGKHHGLFKERLDITSGDQPIKGYAVVSPEDWPQNDEQQ